MVDEAADRIEHLERKLADIKRNRNGIYDRLLLAALRRKS